MNALRILYHIAVGILILLAAYFAFALVSLAAVIGVVPTWY